MSLFDLFRHQNQDMRYIKQEEINTPQKPTLPVNVKEYIKPEEIYTPEEPHGHKAEVQHIEISCEQARVQGWHFKRKSRKRMRITRYTGTDKNIIVPAMIDGYIINEIGQRAFYGANIDNVMIPDTVKKLNSLCFCTSTVKSVTFDEGITEIPDDTFRSCQHLSSVRLPATLKHIGKRAFHSCKNLTYINIPYHCNAIREEAFRGSGLNGFGFAVKFIYDGNVFSDTPLQKNYKLILAPLNYFNKNIDYDVVLVGTGADIKFPGGSVYLGKNSIVHGCTLDLSKCSKITIETDAFYCKRDKLGLTSVQPVCKMIVPQGEKGVYIPEFVDAYYPDGTKYVGYIVEKSKNVNKTTLRVSGKELPSFSITHKRKMIDIESEEPLKFQEYAVSSHVIESISFANIYGEGELFFAWCRNLHKIEWNGEYCAYIPSEELICHQVHKQLLKAFSGRTSVGFYRFFGRYKALRGHSRNSRDCYRFFDSSMINQVFTEPVSNYAKFRAPHKKPVRLSQKSKILIAVDVLRSTESLFENREMYAKYLQTHKRYAEIVCQKLPEKWQEYKDFLKSFYEVI